MDRDYWTRELREAERKLDAATRRSDVDAAAKKLQRAKAALNALEAKTERPKRATSTVTPSCSARSVIDRACPLSILRRQRCARTSALTSVSSRSGFRGAGATPSGVMISLRPPRRCSRSGIRMVRVAQETPRTWLRRSRHLGLRSSPKPHDIIVSMTAIMPITT